MRLARHSSLPPLVFVVWLTSTATAQQRPDGGAPVIDSVIILTESIFAPAEARTNFLFRVANALHVTTRPSVVRHELLFRAGEPYDSAQVAETLRNLRNRGLFRTVRIDTARVGDRVNMLVQTADGWTTELILNGRSTAGTFTWAVGLQERNFLGTGGQVGVVYRNEPDYTALTVAAGMDRVRGTRLGVGGFYRDLSDGRIIGWNVGVPFRAFSDRRAIAFHGRAALDSVLQFRDGVIGQRYLRRLFRQSVEAAIAPRADPRGYFRLGVAAQLKREEFLLDGVPGLGVPDTVTGAFAAFAEFAAARFKVVTYYNGFAREEDLDLSTRLSFAAWLAPRAFGYARTGIGPSVAVQTGVGFGKNFVRLLARANGLFTAAGLDSGQVRVRLTVASQVIPKSATVFHLEAGAQHGVAPGFEFDLGHGRGPRVFEPHAFTGNRTVWGSLEQRAFLIDEVLNLFGIGFAAFVDFGGAWFDDQSPRVGGNVGAGLRIGATRATDQSIGRFDLAYRFGDCPLDLPEFPGQSCAGRRWELSFGRGFAF